MQCAPDSIVFEGVSPARFARALRGRRVTAVRRHGKHLWLELDRRPWPIFHFGMTGGFHAPAGGGVRLIAHGSRDPAAQWPPRFTKLRLFFEGGGELAMADGRRLGRIRLRARSAARSRPSACSAGTPTGSFRRRRSFGPCSASGARPSRRCCSIRASRPGWGTGSPTRCSTRRASPRRAAPHTLTAAEAGRLRTRLRSIVATAVAARSDHARFPRGWLFHHRWGRNAEARTARGERIRHITVGGRTTAWVPTVQR